MIYIAVICSTKTFQANLEVPQVLITRVTNRGKGRVMLGTGAGNSNNSEIILKELRNYIFCNNLQHKIFKVNLVVCPKQPAFLQIGVASEGAGSAPCHFSLNDPIDLGLGMYR